MSPAKLAVFFHFQAVLHGPFVFRSCIISLLALRTSQNNIIPHNPPSLEPTTRIELVTSSLPRMCSTNWATWAQYLILFALIFIWSGKRDSNPRPSAWKADALAPELLPPISISKNPWWWGEDLNLRRLRRQIYSLLPLATREPHQFIYNKTGAGDGTWTRNLLITNQLLYRLSYTSKSHLNYLLISIIYAFKAQKNTTTPPKRIVESNFYRCFCQVNF